MNYIKQILLIAIILTGLSVQAQQTICKREPKTYIVDEGDASPSGSYTWSLKNKNGVEQAISNNGDNEITIDWSDASFDGFSPGDIYKLSVIETIDECPSEEKSFKITLLQGYKSPSIEVVGNKICNGGSYDGFHLEGGTPTAKIGYTITDSAGNVIKDESIDLDLDGSVDIQYPALLDESKQETFTLTLNEIGTDEKCGTLPIEPKVSTNVTIYPKPKTTDIQPKN